MSDSISIRTQFLRLHDYTTLCIKCKCIRKTKHNEFPMPWQELCFPNIFLMEHNSRALWAQIWESGWWRRGNGTTNGCILNLGSLYSRHDLWTSNISTTWDLVRKLGWQVPAQPGVRPTESESAMEQNPKVIHTHLKCENTVLLLLFFVCFKICFYWFF